MDFLSEIIAAKKLRLARAKRERAAEELRAEALEKRNGMEDHRLRAMLARPEGLNIIAEIKRASPSKGLIRADIEPAQVARSYQEHGAAAVSVLTEEDRFGGSLADLSAVRAAVRIPVLRKDFIFDEDQLYEAAAAGADALLLIVAALDEETLARLRRLTEEELGMDALVEVHAEDELRRALRSGATLIGVNNRNLHNFEVSLEVSRQLVRKMPEGILAISESGLRTGRQLAELRALGYSGFLIGESFMRAENPGAALSALTDEAERIEMRGRKSVEAFK
ncbi:MAG TPA: indole-3-glycerol phosphate synthase TrpC [Pyrinomonadaceae bacterium]|jgi:indole-3-glycerol phosphate synthase